MGGKGSSPYGSFSPHVQNADTNAVILEFIQELRHLPPIDLTSVEEVQARIDEYVDLCKKYSIKLQVNGISVALGVNRESYRRYATGELQRCNGVLIPQEVRDIMLDFYNIMATYAEASLNEKTTNPAGDIFLMKNHYGYKDSYEQERHIQVDIPQLASGQEAADKYKALVGVETFDYKQLDAGN